MMKKYFQLTRKNYRFRASLYVDIFISPDAANDLESARMLAEEKMDKLSNAVDNSYVGGVAYYDPHKSGDPLDRDI